jgi:hypothetical protein
MNFRFRRRVSWQAELLEGVISVWLVRAMPQYLALEEDTSWDGPRGMDDSGSEVADTTQHPYHIAPDGKMTDGQFGRKLSWLNWGSVSKCPWRAEPRMTSVRKACILREIRPKAYIWRSLVSALYMGEMNFGWKAKDIFAKAQSIGSIDLCIRKPGTRWQTVSFTPQRLYATGERALHTCWKRGSILERVWTLYGRENVLSLPGVEYLFFGPPARSLRLDVWWS